MPRCEACHIGSIPLNAVHSVLLIDARRLAEHETVPADEALSDRVTEFRARVRAKAPLPPTLGDELREARLRSKAAGDGRA